PGLGGEGWWRAGPEARGSPGGRAAGEGGEHGVAAAAAVAEGLHELGPLLAELRRAEPMPDDLGVGEELVPPAVVAVAVGVDDPPGGPLPDAGVGVDQLPGVGQVPEGVDDEAAAAVDEARVAGAEAAIGLEARVDVSRELAELHATTGVSSRRPGVQLPSGGCVGGVRDPMFAAHHASRVRSFTRAS